jgi:hypothetical protein
VVKFVEFVIQILKKEVKLTSSGFASINTLVIRMRSSPHYKSPAICNHPKNSDIVAGRRPWFFSLRFGEVFHDKFVSFLCLIYFVSIHSKVQPDSSSYGGMEYYSIGRSVA